MEIRYVLPEDDLKEISKVYEQSWRYAYKNMIPQSYLDSIQDGSWTHNINRDGRKNIVMTENGSIIGTSSFGRSRWKCHDNYGEIISLYFLPEYMGKGYGKDLLDRAVRELESLGFAWILLWVLEENQRAKHFYEKYGFVFNGECRTDSIGGKEVKEVMYVYQINACRG